MNLQDLCERIVRDAIPATDSGATCFVPRYQIDQLREAIASAPQPPAEAQAQGGGEVGRQCTLCGGTCGADDRCGRCLAPPSAPVGVEGLVAEMRNFADVADRCQLTEGNAPAAIRAWSELLAQQPAACGTCEPAGVFDTDGNGPFDCYACGKKAQQPAAKSVVWVAEVLPDWTTLRIAATGEAFAFNRKTGRVYKIPHPDCPFVTFPASPTAQQPAAVTKAMVRNALHYCPLDISSPKKWEWMAAHINDALAAQPGGDCHG